MKFLFVTLFMLSPLSLWAEELVFDKLSDTEFHDAMQQIIERAYESLDIKLNYQFHPLVRSSKEAELGRLAGLMGRVKDRDGIRKNLIRLDEPVASFRIVLVVDQLQCRGCTLESARVVGAVTGFEGLRHYLSTSKIKRPLVEVPVRKTLFEMMEKERFDAIIVSDVLLPQTLLDAHPHWLVHELSVEYLYHYLHEQHEALIPQLNSALKEAKKQLSFHANTLNIR